MTQPPPGPATVQTRPADADDIREVARLWHDAFPGERTVGERIRMLEAGGPFGGLETVIVADEAGHGVVGACKMYRMTEYIGGVAMPMMGLAAVAVIPSRRRRGLAARLCADAIEVAAERGDVISALYPFRPDYYRRLGWGLVGALHEFRFHTRALEVAGPDGIGAAADRVRRAELDRDAGAMAACYRRVAERSNGPIDRNRHVWAYRLTGEELGVRPVDAEAVWTARAEPTLRPVVYDDNGIRGYALLRYRRQASPTDATLQVRELIAEDDAAYRGLLVHIAGQHDQWPLCHYFARPAERFGDFLTDPRPPRFRNARSLYFPTGRIVRGPMLRLLDVPAALRMRRYFDAVGGAPATFGITVIDDQRPANTGTWTVHVDAGGKVGVEEGAAPADATLETDVSGLARMFAGEIPVTVAAGQGRARVEGDGAVLDRAFATRERFWLLDEF